MPNRGLNSLDQQSKPNDCFWLLADMERNEFEVRSIPNSGHSMTNVRFLPDYVRSYPRSRHSGGVAECPELTQSGHCEVTAPTQQSALFGQMRPDRLLHLSMFHQPLLPESFGLGDLARVHALGNNRTVID